jgi:hypothetical protein
MNDQHKGHEIDLCYDWLNMLDRLIVGNPNRCKEFNYSQETVYYYLDRLQNEHLTPD